MEITEPSVVCLWFLWFWARLKSITYLPQKNKLLKNNPNYLLRILIGCWVVVLAVLDEAVIFQKKEICVVFTHIFENYYF